MYLINGQPLYAFCKIKVVKNLKEKEKEIQDLENNEVIESFSSIEPDAANEVVDPVDNSIVSSPEEGGETTTSDTVSDEQNEQDTDNTTSDDLLSQDTIKENEDILDAIDWEGEDWIEGKDGVNDHIIDFVWKKPGSEGGDNTFIITAFDETAIELESKLANESGDSTGIQVFYGWASRGEAIPGRSHKLKGQLQEYSISFNGPSTELNIVGVLLSGKELAKSGNAEYPSDQYHGNPSEVIKAICLEHGWDTSGVVETKNVYASNNDYDPNQKPKGKKSSKRKSKVKNKKSQGRKKPDILSFTETGEAYIDKEEKSAIEERKDEATADDQQSREYKTYIQGNRSLKKFIEEDLCKDAVTPDGKAGFVFFVTEEEVEESEDTIMGNDIDVMEAEEEGNDILEPDTLVDADSNEDSTAQSSATPSGSSDYSYESPYGRNSGGTILVAHFQPESSVGESDEIKIDIYDKKGNVKPPEKYEDGNTTTNYLTVAQSRKFNYYTGQYNNEIISFTPSYTFSVGAGMANSTQSTNRDSNEQYKLGIKGSVQVNANGDTATINGYRMLGMPSGDYEMLSTQAIALWKKMRSSQTTATLEILGDPQFQRTALAKEGVSIEVFTKYGLKHHTSGEYSIVSVEESVSNGLYVTTLELQKGDYTGSLDNGQLGNNGGPSSSNTSYSGGNDILSYASQYIGNNYKWGGSNPNVPFNPGADGIDCSHFTHYVLTNTGHYSGSYGNSAKQREWGQEVSKENVQPGDLLCYNGHVAFYMDSNHIIHARGKDYGIEITECDPLSYHNGVVTIRRL